MDDQTLETLLRGAAEPQPGPSTDDAFVLAVMQRVTGLPSSVPAATALAGLAALRRREARLRRYGLVGALLGSLGVALSFQWDEAGRALLASGPAAWQGVFGSMLVALAVLAAAGLSSGPKRPAR